MQRVLACVRCQQRKVKCNRVFPCSNCNTSITREQCVPATLAPRSGPRRRRFKERELLERLRKYEDLLHENNIEFEPLHESVVGENLSFNSHVGDETADTPGAVKNNWPSPPATVMSEGEHEIKDLWHAWTQKIQDPDNESDSSHDDVRDVVARQTWVQLFGENDHLLFGSPITDLDLSSLHPESVQIFRLWQIYLDNVNPLLKVTHTPSLQIRIIEAASDLTNISPALQALMFSIYCIAILSLEVKDCQAIFGSSKTDLLLGFRFGCQQALLKSRYLRSSDRDCLTALYLYLVSVRANTVPQSLSAMLGIAIRIAQRMGIHSESSLAKCTAFEAELRRRLWWSLALFDTRISELAEHKSATLNPTWDCRIPLHANDSDLRPEMKELPDNQNSPTEALFAVVRSELGEFVRHAKFYLGFTCPALKHMSNKHVQVPGASEVAALESTIERRYLMSCDLDNPLHFITVWWSRAFIARCHLLEHHSRHFTPSGYQTDAHRDAAISMAIRMLQCDTKFMSSAYSTRFLWLSQLYFPCPAYIQIIQDLRKRPESEKAELAWIAMSDNYETRFAYLPDYENNPFFQLFNKIIPQAWEARKAILSELGEPVLPPKIVSLIRQRVARAAQKILDTDKLKLTGCINIYDDELPISMPVDPDSHVLLYSRDEQTGRNVAKPETHVEMPMDAALDIDMYPVDWATMDWGFGGI